MKKQSVLISWRGVVIALSVAAVLMAVGSFVDYQLSCALYNEKNWFAMFFAAYGETPATLGFVGASTMLLVAHDREKKGIGVLQCIIGCVILISSTLMYVITPGKYLPFSKVVLGIISVIICALVVTLVYFLTKNGDRKTAVRIATAVILAIGAEIIIINIIKVPWARPRMRLIANDPRAYFVPWWQAGGGAALKSALAAVGVSGEQFKSFPSGHTGNASMMLLLGFLPMLQPKFEKYKSALLAFGFTWTAIVAFTRIIMGAHFLTDVTMGFVVGLLCCYAVCKIVFREKELGNK